MKVLALLALAASLADQDMLVAYAAEATDDSTVPSDEQPLADTEGVGCNYYWDYYSSTGSLCNTADCATGFYSTSKYDDCKCLSGTCSYYG